jgi:hypothetical protein
VAGHVVACGDEGNARHGDGGQEEEDAGEFHGGGWVFFSPAARYLWWCRCCSVVAMTEISKRCVETKRWRNNTNILLRCAVEETILQDYQQRTQTIAWVSGPSEAS